MKNTQPLYGLIGKKLGHSFSPGYFGERFAREGIHARYETFELGDIWEFQACLKAHPNLRGLNVTVPYKKAIIPFLDSLDETAALLGAVNTIAFDDDGKLRGYNTDVTGFQMALQQAWGKKPLHQAVVLGTGGSAQAVLHVLTRRLGLKRPLVVSRSPAPGQLGYPDLGMLLEEDFDIVINTTPLGMYPDTAGFPDFPYQVFGENHLAFDLIYNPLETTFLKKAKAQGARTVNGLTMLFGQADASWSIWQKYQRS